MIVSFRSKALRLFWEEENSSKVNQDHMTRILYILDALDSAGSIHDLNVPGFRLHKLNGTKDFSIDVSKNWRITFRITKDRVSDVNYRDTH